MMTRNLNDKIRVGVLGASGYTGADAVRLLLEHDGVLLTALTANTHAGSDYGEVFPQFRFYDLPRLARAEDVDWNIIDAVICGLPHGTAQDVISVLPAGVRVIDMSADFRFRSVSVYESVYGRRHVAPKLNERAVYGLSEHYREQIVDADLVACPGCYPTASLLALLPPLKAGVLAFDDIIIDAKSGVSGRGHGVSAQSQFCEIAEGMHPYSAGTHRHTPEIEAILGTLQSTSIRVNFTPHLVPMNRGELVSIYARLAAGADVGAVYESLVAAYQNEAFVHVLEPDVLPETRHVRGANHCIIGVCADRLDGRVMIFAVIDNLVKGSAGQAVQNLNIMFGFAETTGLTHIPLFP